MNESHTDIAASVRQQPPHQGRQTKPMILAPAGSRASFLAALAAGADAIYCGLKSFSARMEAKNFNSEELARLTRLAHAKGTRVYVTLNTLLKPDELVSAGSILRRLTHEVRPDALIIQDLAFLRLARRAGYRGELHLSTLANVSFPAALATIGKELKIDRVVIPRELDIDEIKAMDAQCPAGFELEAFIHGALCYAVSGRCYWSSYMGGKSGLRGRCVQPCRRIYTTKGQSKRLFSCQDFSVDVLVKILATVPRVRVWKIEGRKKGPHYVFYAVKAYQMLRDHGRDPKIKRNALDLLAQSLGRRTTHYNFLPQRPQKPVETKDQTASGLLMGRVRGGAGNLFLVPRQELLPGDSLRIGYEDEAGSGHARIRVSRFVPKKGRLHLKIPGAKNIRKGTPAFLTDRHEKALVEMIADLEKKLARVGLSKAAPKPKPFKLRLSRRTKSRRPVWAMSVHRTAFDKSRPGPKEAAGLWVGPGSHKKLPRTGFGQLWFWLPPVIWPRDQTLYEELITQIRHRGGRNFMLNAPWQTSLFSSKKGVRFWAGPFCNIANPLALEAVKSLGFEGVIVSPELGKKDYLTLPQNSPLPLGIVLEGMLPLCISRTLTDELKTGQSFDSPRGEGAWASRYGSDFWVFPNWVMDLCAQREVLTKAGYELFVKVVEPVPKGIRLKKRPGLWNWNVGLR
jgi:putative protease